MKNYIKKIKFKITETEETKIIFNILEDFVDRLTEEEIENCTLTFSGVDICLFLNHREKDKGINYFRLGDLLNEKTSEKLSIQFVHFAKDLYLILIRLEDKWQKHNLVEFLYNGEGEFKKRKDY